MGMTLKLSFLVMKKLGQYFVEKGISYIHNTPKLRANVRDILIRLRESVETGDLTKLYSESIPDAADNRYTLVSLDKNLYSVIMLDTKHNTMFSLFIGDHETALEWANKHRFQINNETGEIQPYEVPRLPEQIDAGNISTPIFANLTDDQLIQLGVPKEQLPAIRNIRSAEELRSAYNGGDGYLLPTQYQYLSWLVQGKSYDDTYKLFRSEQSPKKNVTSLTEALGRPAGQANYMTLNSNDDIDRFLDASASIEEWRVFLHPAQQRYVDADYAGPVRILGGAGTGKTVVAMHRARRLASKLPEGEKMLFTTYTKTLTEDIRTNLQKICSPEELSKIEIKTFDSCA